MSFSFHSGYLYCCGHREIGDFDEGEYVGNTAKEAYNRLSNNDANGTVYTCWFADNGGDEEYYYQEFRELCQTMDGVIHLGSYKNPNSGNTIDGYCWVNKGPI